MTTTKETQNLPAGWFAEERLAGFVKDVGDLALYVGEAQDPREAGLWRWEIMRDGCFQAGATTPTFAAAIITCERIAREMEAAQ